ncbi:hypothetical protein ACFW0H_14985 [Pseudomonas sp. CR3202]|uniref:hypothetical protein n=1 Tax=Pseudomonas sp. CR3202 TaxID=3351532 RepID=UPI003BF09EF2
MASNKPAYEAFIATQKGEGKNIKTFWHKVGVIWMNNTGTGFNLDIPPGISISGRVVLLPYRYLENGGGAAEELPN